MVKLKREGNVLKIAGQVDSTSAGTLENWCLKQAESSKGDLTLDLSDVTYMGSSGFGVVMALRAYLLKNGRKCRIRASKPVKEIFDIGGLSPLIELE